jgi:hypothetical protein
MRQTHRRKIIEDNDPKEDGEVVNDEAEREKMTSVSNPKR